LPSRPGSTEKVVEFCAALPAPVRVSFEAGPTGFGLARALDVAGVDCLVAAPGKIARPAQTALRPTVATPSCSCACYRGAAARRARADARAGGAARLRFARARICAAT